MPVRLPRNLGHMLFGVWLVGMAFAGGDPRAPIQLTAGFFQVVLGVVLIAAGVCMLLDI